VEPDDFSDFLGAGFSDFLGAGFSDAEVPERPPGSPTPRYTVVCFLASFS
jgi:hypothetical protein